jgi:hypothetical protein
MRKVLYIPKATSAPPRAGTTGIYIYIRYYKLCNIYICICMYISFQIVLYYIYIYYSTLKYHILYIIYYISYTIFHIVYTISLYIVYQKYISYISYYIIQYILYIIHVYIYNYIKIYLYIHSCVTYITSIMYSVNFRLCNHSTAAQVPGSRLGVSWLSSCALWQEDRYFSGWITIKKREGY